MTYNDFYETILEEYTDFNPEVETNKASVLKLKRFCEILSMFAEQNFATDLTFQFLQNGTIYIALHGMYTAYFSNRDYEENNEPRNIFTQLLNYSLSFRISNHKLKKDYTLSYEFIIPGI